MLCDAFFSHYCWDFRENIFCIYTEQEKMTQEYFNSILVNNYEYDKFKENYKLIEEEYSFFNDQFGEIPEEFFK